MKKLLSLLIYLLLGTLSAQAQDESPWPKQFSGEQTIQTGGKTMSAKVFIDNSRIRTDTTVSGMQMSTIMRIDKKMSYTIMPAQKIVMQLPMTTTDEDAMAAYGASSKMELVAEENVGGVDCIKYRIPTGSELTHFMWINKKTKLPVKMEANDGSIKVDWHNVVAGPQPDSLFEPPADYKVMNMPVKK